MTTSKAHAAAGWVRVARRWLGRVEGGGELGAPSGEGEGEGCREAGVGEDRVGGAAGRSGVVLRGDGDDAFRYEGAVAGGSGEPGDVARELGAFVEDCGGEFVPGGLARGGHVVGAGEVCEEGERIW